MMCSRTNEDLDDAGQQTVGASAHVDGLSGQSTVHSRFPVAVALGNIRKMSSMMLADPYDPLTMPGELRKAPSRIQSGYEGRKDEASHVASRFERYQGLTSLLQPPKLAGRKRLAKLASA